MPARTAFLFALAACLLLGADRPRIPRAIVWGPDGLLHVATREGSSLIRVDVEAGKVVSETEVGAKLNSLVVSADKRAFYAGTIDGGLLVLGLDGKVVSRHAIGTGPARVLALTDSKVLVTTLWDHCARMIDASSGRELARHRFDFSPGAMVGVKGGRVVIADAFGGHLVLITPGQPELDRVITFDGTSLRGLAVADRGETLLVAHVQSFGTMPITKSNIDWGLVLSSKLTGVRVEDMPNSRPGVVLPSHRIALDGSRNGAANPEAVAATDDGKYLLVAASGAHHLLVQGRDLDGPGPSDGLPRLGNSSYIKVVETGRNPVGVVISPSSKLAITVDSMSDTLTVVDIASATRKSTIRLGPGAVDGPALRGEALFHDGRRSLDRWMSCATCHADGHTTGLRFDTLGDGDHGAAKDTPSLLGVGSTAPHAWTGRFAVLQEQVAQSLESSMHGPAPTPADLSDLLAYLRSLEPPPGPEPAGAIVEEGRKVFEARQCTNCHKPPTYAGTGRFEVGLEDENGETRFNPPSLRGVSRSAPYFHDGRALRLIDVVRKHSPASETPLSPQDEAALLGFLRSL